MPGHCMLGNGAEIHQSICFWDTNYVVDKAHTEEYFFRKNKVYT